MTTNQKSVIIALKNGTMIYLFSNPLMYRLGKLGRFLNWDWCNKMISDGYFETTDTISSRWNEFTLTEKGKLL
jgi:hypothetical protein